MEVRDLRVRLGGSAVVDGVTLTLGQGELVALMGRSGTGKSVFIKAVVGLVPVESGQVLLNGMATSAPRLRERVVMVHQTPALLDERSVWDNVWEPLRWRGVGAAAANHQATSALDACSVDRPWNAAASTLSAGQRKCLALARAVAQRPLALLLDEPTTGLDAASAARVALTCGQLAASGLGLLVVTHDLAPFSSVFSRCVLLHRGRLVCEQTASEVQRAPHPALAQLLAGNPHGPLTDAADVDAA